MPHCIIEHANTISPAPLHKAVLEGAVASGLFEQQDGIKVRSLAYDHYQTGNHQQDFVHVTLKILSGRSESQKQSLSASVLQQLQKLAFSDMSLTVEVQDMHKASYAKIVL